MKSQLLTYSRARGIFAGVDLTGSPVTQDKDETRILQGNLFLSLARLRRGKSPLPALRVLTFLLSSCFGASTVGS